MRQELYEDLARRAIEATGRLRAGGSEPMVDRLAEVMRAAARGAASVRRCSFCGRLELDGEWLALEPVGAEELRVRTSVVMRATHGTCPGCQEKKEIRRG
jgi:hypothetical protein